jgi:hypothetical protein
MQTLGSAIKYSKSTFGNRLPEIKIAANTILASAVAYKNRAIDHSKKQWKDGIWRTYRNNGGDDNSNIQQMESELASPVVISYSLV